MKPKLLLLLLLLTACQQHIPVAATRAPYTPTPQPSGDKINVNTASAAELDTLPGIGPSTAQAIIAHREQHGLFQSIDDLLAVRGIGENKLDAIRDLVATQ